MGRNMGIEPMHTGATIRRVNHFTNTAIHNAFLINKKYILILPIKMYFDKSFFYLIINGSSLVPVPFEYKASLAK